MVGWLGDVPEQRCRKGLFGIYVSEWQYRKDLFDNYIVWRREWVVFLGKSVKNSEKKVFWPFRRVKRTKRDSVVGDGHPPGSGKPVGLAYL